jgi:probable HAF family extracellular repeat protein
MSKSKVYKIISLCTFLVIAMSFISFSSVLSEPLLTGTSIYTIYDLGILGVDFCTANDINNNGQIILYTANPYYHAFLWEDGEFTDLGTLGGLYSIAHGINDNGQIVGYSQNTDEISRAFLWENGVMSELAILDGNYSVAMDINEAGIIVGGLDMETSGEHAYKLENGIITDIGTLGSDYESTAMALNNNGVIVGVSLGSTGYHAFRYENGVMSGLGTLGGPKSQALDVNDFGSIVGEAYIDDDDDYHAFLWEGAGMIDLGTLSFHDRSVAYAINNSGQIVGRSYELVEDWNGLDGRAVIWENDQIIDLNTWLPINSGWVLKSAMGINDKGDIVGFGEINGEIHAFPLASTSNNPTPSDTPIIPTPIITPVKIFLPQVKLDPFLTTSQTITRTPTP